jgi:hypothetical protein
MFREVLDFLVGDGWPVEPGDYDGFPCITSHFTGTRESWTCRARPYDPFGQLVFESVLPEVIAAERRPEVATLLLQVNWRLLTGAFHLDLDSGEALFRTTLLLPDDAPLTEALCRGLVYGNVLTMDRCVDEVLRSARGADPAEAFARLAL